MPADPFSLTASLAMPPDTGQPNENLNYSLAGTFNSATQQRLELNGSGTHVVSFGTVPTSTTSGARVVWLEHEKPATGNPSPIGVAINGGTSIAVAAGGFMAWSNPPAGVTPGFITSLSINFTSSCTVRVALLG
jgi:hypothetical protein